MTDSQPDHRILMLASSGMTQLGLTGPGEVIQALAGAGGGGRGRLERADAGLQR